MDYSYSNYISKWKSGEGDGSLKGATRNISRHLKRYLLEKCGERCSVCKWNKRNVITGKVPLEVDHIDRDSDNNLESNLRIICPNCHSLTSNFRNLNKGSGRNWRRVRYMKSN